LVTSFFFIESLTVKIMHCTSFLKLCKEFCSSTQKTSGKSKLGGRIVLVFSAPGRVSIGAAVPIVVDADVADIPLKISRWRLLIR
jgi:hypothetical protein